MHLPGVNQFTMRFALEIIVELIGALMATRLLIWLIQPDENLTLTSLKKKYLWLKASKLLSNLRFLTCRVTL